MILWRSNDEVLQWVQARITCLIPEENSKPELHQLVTKYQHHKCNSYCQQKRNGLGILSSRDAGLDLHDRSVQRTYAWSCPTEKCTHFLGHPELTTTIHCFSCCGRPTCLSVSPRWSLPTMWQRLSVVTCRTCGRRCPHTPPYIVNCGPLVSAACAPESVFSMRPVISS